MPAIDQSSRAGRGGGHRDTPSGEESSFQGRPRHHLHLHHQAHLHHNHICTPGTSPAHQPTPTAPTSSGAGCRRRSRLWRLGVANPPKLPRLVSPVICMSGGGTGEPTSPASCSENPARIGLNSRVARQTRQAEHDVSLSDRLVINCRRSMKQAQPNKKQASPSKPKQNRLPSHHPSIHPSTAQTQRPILNPLPLPTTTTTIRPNKTCSSLMPPRPTSRRRGQGTGGGRWDEGGA